MTSRPPLQQQRISYASTNSSSLNIDSYYSANEGDTDNASFYSYNAQYNPDAHRKRSTWNSVGASTIRLSARQSMISNNSSYYSLGDRGNDRIDNHLSSPVSFQHPSRILTLTKASAESLQSEFDFNAYEASNPSSPKSFDTSNQSSLATPQSFAGSSSSPNTLHSSENATFQSLSQQELESSSTAASSHHNMIPAEHYGALPHLANKSQEQLSVKSRGSTPGPNGSVNTFKVHPLSYENEVFDTSYESSNPKSPQAQASPLLPPSVKGPLIIPRESFVPIFNSSNENLPSGSSGAFRVSRTSDSYSEHSNVNSVRDSVASNKNELPYVVHPARPFMPHVYRMRQIEPGTLGGEADDVNASEAVVPSSPLEAQNEWGATSSKDFSGTERVSKLGLIPVYNSANIDSLSRFPYKNSQTPERVIETPVQSPPGVGASANMTQRFDWAAAAVPIEARDKFASETAGLAGRRNFAQFETSKPALTASQKLVAQQQQPAARSKPYSEIVPNVTGRSTSNPVSTNMGTRSSSGGSSSTVDTRGGMQAPMPNLFGSRAGSRHNMATAGMLPPVALRPIRTGTRRSKSGNSRHKNSSISSTSGLLNDSSDSQHQPMTSIFIRQQPSQASIRPSLRDASETRSQSSIYADAIAGPSHAPGLDQQQQQPQAPPRQDVNAAANPAASASRASIIAPPTSLPTMLPRTAPNPPEVSEAVNATNPLEPRAQAKRYRRETSNFVTRVKRSQEVHPHSVASDDEQLAATAAAAREISDETDWPENPNAYTSEKHRAHDDDGNPLCNAATERFLLCVFALFPPLWLLLGAGLLDGLVGRVSTRGKLIAFVLSGAFFLMAIAGLVVGLTIGVS